MSQIINNNNNNNNNNRYLQKANRNLFQDQIVYIASIASKTGRSESEILREIIDFHIKNSKETLEKWKD